MAAYYNEIDPYCCKVLAKQIKAGNLPAGDIDDRSIVDVKPEEIMHYTQRHYFAGIGGIPYGLRLAGWPDSRSIDTGGFPCQDISKASKGPGIHGTRSGLWYNWLAHLSILRPKNILIENVTALFARGFESVLCGLAQIGYDVRWDCVPAAAIGALHIRDRIFIYAHANMPRLEEWESISSDPCPQQQAIKRSHLQRSDFWATESGICGISHGIPDRVHRIRALGNAVVPQVIAAYVQFLSTIGLIEGDGNATAAI